MTKCVGVVGVGTPVGRFVDRFELDLVKVGADEERPDLVRVGHAERIGARRRWLWDNAASR
jgi:hypothetical protein